MSIKKIALYNSSNVIVNIIELDDEVTYEVPDGLTCVEITGAADIGWTVTGGSIDVPPDDINSIKLEKIKELRSFRDNENESHRILQFDGANNDYANALPVIVNKSSMDGANNVRDRLGINGTSSIEWYFDDGTETTQRTEKLLTSGDINQLLKRLVERDMDIRRMFHKKEAETLALLTVQQVSDYDIQADTTDGTKWP